MTETYKRPPFEPQKETLDEWAGRVYRGLSRYLDVRSRQVLARESPQLVRHGVEEIFETLQFVTNAIDGALRWDAERRRMEA